MITGINGNNLMERNVENSNQLWKNDKCEYECKKYICEKDYICNPATCSCENGKYLASIIDDSVISCDEIIEEETKAVKTNFNEKKCNL